MHSRWRLPSTKSQTWSIVRLGLVPIILLLAAMWAVVPPETLERGDQQRGFVPAHRFRTVVFILDSAGKSEMFDPALMPFLSSLQTSSLSGGSRSCAAKATFPCIKSIFEGRFESNNVAGFARRARDAAGRRVGPHFESALSARLC